MSIEQCITNELRFGTPQSPTKLDIALALFAASGESRKAAGRYGAYRGKAWRTWLITVLTDSALREAGATSLATRERVRRWQHDTFGQALSSRYLSQYAQSLGYRGEDLGIRRTLGARYARLFEKYKHELARRVDRHARRASFGTVP